MTSPTPSAAQVARTPFGLHERALSRTTNMFVLYVHACGIGDVPVSFNLWACISAIAAAVGDRVCFYRIREQPLFPNLYTFLVERSGSGKGIAISNATRFLKYAPSVGYYEGKITAAGFFDYMSQEKYDRETNQTLPPNNRMYLVTPELALSIGKREHAETFIELMTETYSGGNKTITDTTRSNGTTRIENPCINWLAGTTREWLLRSIGLEAIQSGFYARVLTVYRDAWDAPRQVFRPRYPDDVEEVTQHLQARFAALGQIYGAFDMTPGAEAALEQWLSNRRPPDDELLEPSFNREREMLLKLAMVCALAESYELRIHARHIIRARALLAQVSRNIPSLVNQGMKGVESKHVMFTADALCRGGTMSHSALLRRLQSKGMTARHVKLAIDHLVQQGDVEVRCAPGSTAKEYIWLYANQ